jgi:hypothetical protein
MAELPLSSPLASLAEHQHTNIAADKPLRCWTSPSSSPKFPPFRQAVFIHQEGIESLEATNADSRPNLARSPPFKRVRLDEDDIDTAIQDEFVAPSLSDGPGNPIRPETFFDCQGDRKLAGYLGFLSMPDFHVCAISWPFLRATVAIYPILHKLNRELALALIRDAERIGDSAAIDNHWSPLNSDGKGLSNARKAEHLAIVLVNLRSDLATMTAASDKQNQLQHQHDCHNFNTRYPTHVCPQISYPVRPPILSLLPGEDFLETYNRCFLLLRHMRNIMKTNVFDTRYKHDSFKSGLPVKDEHRPVWMRSAVPSMTSTVPKRGSHVAAANSADLFKPSQLAPSLSYSTIYSIETKPRRALPAESTLPINHTSPDELSDNFTPTARSFAVIWDHDLEPEYMRSRIKCAMSRAQSKDVDAPSELQKLRKDPRQMIEEPMLYEQIRIQFRCHFLGIDLSKLMLQYTTSAFGDRVTVKQNLQDESWSDTQAALSDPANDNFVFRVGFFAVGN